MYLLPLGLNQTVILLDVHDNYPVHLAPEMGVKPPSRSYGHSEISISVGTNDNVDESCELRFTPISSHFRSPKVTPAFAAISG